MLKSQKLVIQRPYFNFFQTRSQISIRSNKSEIQVEKATYIPPLDVLTVKVLSLRLSDEPKKYAIKITFSAQLLLSGVIQSIGKQDVDTNGVLISGTMAYDPSDYERMCLLADHPLTVKIQLLKNVEENIADIYKKSNSNIYPDISCCNVDILPLFVDKNIMCVKKRLEPMYEQSVLQQKSWQNLPLLTMELVVERNPLNIQHHNILKSTNYMKLTLVGVYNTLVPFYDDFVYTAASKMPTCNEMNTGLIIYNQGGRISNRFKSSCFYPNWETLRLGDEIFSKSDEKFAFSMNDLINDDNFDLEFYVNKQPHCYNAIWGSFHRTLLLESSSQWFLKHIRRYKWPLEVHIYGENGGYSFMANLDFTKLLYPGEYKVCMAVPLHWINPDVMLEECGCELMLTPNDRPPTSVPTEKPSKVTTASARTSSVTDVGIGTSPTGSGGSNAFAIIEVKLARPLIEASVPPYISETELNNMLKTMEQRQIKRECTGRGQLEKDWQSTAKTAANSLRRVPYYGMTEFCAASRQLSQTRTRIEIFTSFWQDAAVYVNNNFVVQEYLESDEMFEELLMMSHVCLMRSACAALTDGDGKENMEPTLRAARHARQMQDYKHAMDLYLQLIVEKPRDAEIWRELAVCMRDIDREWANVCINKSTVLDPRHPLTLLIKASMVFEDDPVAAEPFFLALLALHPFWYPGWIISSVYYTSRELFHVADKIVECSEKCRAEGPLIGYRESRYWEQELGDWWDHTPLLPGMNKYYNAADLLLRIRSIPLAEICLAHALKDIGETVVYYHLLALCCRLRGRVNEVLCHLKVGIEKYGEISYLRSLEAECYHQSDKCHAAHTCFEKAGNCVEPYSALLSIPSLDAEHATSTLLNIVRRQPSAYSWMALAEDWLAKAAMGEGGDAGLTEEQENAKSYTVACLIQALKWDRFAGKAWALLGELVKPSARRMHCINMAIRCGYGSPGRRMESNSNSKQSFCYQLGTALRECRCKQNIKF